MKTFKRVRYRKEGHGVYVVYVNGHAKAFGNNRHAKKYFKDMRDGNSKGGGQ